MDRPFDARRAMLIDSGQPPHKWRPVSLVVALRAALLQEPTTLPTPVNNHRQRTIRAIMDELTNRGLDGDSLVRFGMGPEIVGAILEFLIPDWFATTGLDVAVSATRSTLALAGTAQTASAPRDISTGWRCLMETRLIEHVDVRRNVAALAASAADSLGLREDQARWDRLAA